MYKGLRIACVSPNAPATRKVGVVPPFFCPPFLLVATESSQRVDPSGSMRGHSRCEQGDHDDNTG